VIDPPAAKALYAPLLADMPRGGEVLRDIAYGEDERHRLDVYLPLGAEGPAPVVVFLHGGGFIRGDKGDREAVGHYFSRHGVLAVLPNYRLGPRHRWPAGAEDVSAAAGLGARPCRCARRQSGRTSCWPANRPAPPTSRRRP
jgi:acetyl esterase